MDVIHTDEFAAWFEEQAERLQDDVAVVVGLLEQRGVALGFPHSSALGGTKYALRELRITSQRLEVRVAYAFDPARDAVLIIGAIKAGMGTDRFYGELVASAEKIWSQYLAERARGEHGGK
jgi:hypothetical protein